MAGVNFPNLGYAVEAATVLGWLKKPGEPVVEGEDLLELGLEKAVIAVTAPASGVLLATYAPPGALVAPGETLGWVGQAGDTPPDIHCRILGWEEGMAPPAEKAHGAEGSGWHPAQTVDKTTRQRMKDQLRPTTAQRMEASWHAPKVDLFFDVDFSKVMAHRQRVKAAGGDPASYNMYLAHAVRQAFLEYPQLNGHWRQGRFHPLEAIHVGVAVDVGGGLLTISLKQVDRLGLDELQSHMKGLIRKALAMKLAPDELFGSSLTITNLGETGLRAFSALLNPPEVFILAVGALEERAVVIDGQLAVRPICTLCLSFDHRAVDGAPAAAFFKAIKTALEGFEG